MGSGRSNSRASSAYSAAFRGQVRAEAAATKKKVEIRRKRSLAESQSAMLVQQLELTLSQCKLNEKARLEQLRLEEEAEIAIAKMIAVDEELGFRLDPHGLDLPEENINESGKLS